MRLSRISKGNKDRKGAQKDEGGPDQVPFRQP